MLAGGRSRRMGRDEAGLGADGSGATFLEHALGRLRTLTGTLAVCGLAEGAGLAPSALAATVIPDPRHAGEHPGPLAGIEAGLAAGLGERNLFLAVDLPAIPAQLLGWLAARAQQTGALATIPRCGGRPQPLAAVYRSGLAAALRRQSMAGERRVLAAVSAAAAAEGGDIDLFDIEPVAAAGAFDAPGWPWQWFLNVNTPRDLEAFVRNQTSVGWHREEIP